MTRLAGFAHAPEVCRSEDYLSSAAYPALANGVPFAQSVLLQYAGKKKNGNCRNSSAEHTFFNSLLLLDAESPQSQADVGGFNRVRQRTAGDDVYTGGR